MEYISSFIYCDTIQTETTPHGTQNKIINPLQTLTPVAIPSNYSFTISCGISGFDDSKENEIQIMFIDPVGSVIYDTGCVKFQLPIKQVNNNEIANMQFNIDIRNLILRQIGVYSTKIIFNGNELGNYKIQVIIGEENVSN